MVNHHDFGLLANSSSRFVSTDPRLRLSSEYQDSKHVLAEAEIKNSSVGPPKLDKSVQRLQARLLQDLTPVSG